MVAKTLMVQGTAASVGKRILVTALCRIFKQDGLRVAPFQAQNMTQHVFTTGSGEKMGGAQAVEAEAAGIEPGVDMNSILMIPEANFKSRIMVSGKPVMTLAADQYWRRASEFFPAVEESLSRLLSAYDIVVIEGAGSPAEVNIRENEIVNMRVARLAQAPVLLVGDIDRGGVFASLVGTLALLDESERDIVKGLVINKFRGDIAWLQSGLDYLEKYTAKPVIGVIPYYQDISIPEAEAMSGEKQGEVEGGLFADATSYRRTFMEREGQLEMLPLKTRPPLPSRQPHYDALAKIVRRSLNLKLVYQICGLG